MKSIWKTVIYGASWSTVSVIIQSFFLVLSVMILARLLTAEDFGLVALATVFIAFANFIPQIGFTTALIHKSKISEGHIRSAFTATMLLSVLSFVCIQFLAESLSIYFDYDEVEGILRISSISILITSLGITSQSLLEKKLQFKFLSLLNIVSFLLVYFPTVVILALLDFAAYSIIIAHILDQTTRTVACLCKERHNLIPKIKIQEFKELSYYSGGLTLSRIFNTIASQAEFIIIGKILGISLLGLYERTTKIIMLPINITGDIVDKVNFPAMSLVQDDLIQLSRLYLGSLTLILFLLLPLSALMLIFSEDIILIALGETWLSGVPVFRILVLFIALRTVIRLIDSLVRATGLVYQSAMIKFIFLILIIVFTILGSQYGLKGAAIGINLSIIVNYLLMASLANRRTKTSLKRFILAHIPGLIFTTILFLTAGLPYIFFRDIVGQSLGQRLIFTLITTLSLINGCLFFFRDKVRNLTYRRIINYIQEYTNP